jgi:hypothetical protein
MLEKALVALLNEENDKAQEYFHNFIVERARQIHESNRSGDEFALEENWDQEISSEHYFTEEDLTDLEDGDEDDVADDENLETGDVADDAGAFGAEDGVDGVDDAAGELGDDLGEPADDLDTDLNDEPETVEDQIDELTGKIDDMVSKFEQVMAAFNGEAEADAGVDGDETLDEPADEFAPTDDEGLDVAPEGDEDEADEIQDDMADTDEDDVNEDEDLDDDYDDMNESVLSELQAIKIALTDGDEIGTGPSFTQNKSAAIPQKSKEARQGGAPVQIKSKNHSGFARETAPTVAAAKQHKNNKPTAPSMEKISKEGNKPAAEVNKLKSDGNNVSPLIKK